jgi:geranylgeranyl pyrophosphate synthase
MQLLDPIYRSIKDELVSVEIELSKQIEDICIGQDLESELSDYVRGAVEHLFRSPGKLLRPALVLYSARAVGGAAPRRRRTLIAMAAAVELVHSASLIHDDIIDEAETRRGQVSVNGMFGDHSAVLVGDILYSQFFCLVTDLAGVTPEDRIVLLDLFSSTTKGMCQGEIYDQRIKTGTSLPSLKDYLTIIEKKTAALMSACCLSGALLSGADRRTSAVLADYGLNLGFTYQLVDDYLDGDSVYDDKEVLLTKALEFSNRTREAASRLERKGGQSSLIALCDFVIERANVKVLPV